MAQITIEQQGAMLVCRFVNPPEGYMDSQTTPELEAILDRVEADDSIRVLVFTGGLPGVFIRHYSVVELEGLSENLRERNFAVEEGRSAPESALHQVFRRVSELPKPVIAAINGTAMGGGFEFALCCDIRIAEDGPYSLGLPEINVGILPGAGGTQKLARLVGTARALELILRGRTVTPGEALELGMVHEVAPPGRVLDRAMEYATELAQKSPLAVRHIKELVRTAPDTPINDGLARERTLFLDLVVSDDALQLMSEMNQGVRDIRDP
jgi:enoyl-CoA hydratase